MSRALRFTQLAQSDLIELHAWIEDAVGIEIADAYQARLEARCVSLTEFPGQGTPRDELVTDLRSVAFERRVIIFYQFDDSEVTIMRVVSGARDLASAYHH